MATRKTKRKGSKSRGSVAAQGVEPKPEAFKVPRTAKQLAQAIWARTQRSPGYWRDVARLVGQMERARETQPEGLSMAH